MGPADTGEKHQSAGQIGEQKRNCWCHARTASTANSGRVCSSASTARAIPCARKNCAASAPHAIIRLATRMPGPAQKTANGLAAGNSVSASSRARRQEEFHGRPTGSGRIDAATAAEIRAASRGSRCGSARRGFLHATRRTRDQAGDLMHVAQFDGREGRRSGRSPFVRSSVRMADSRPARSRTMPQYSQVRSRISRSVIAGTSIGGRVAVGTRAASPAWHRHRAARAQPNTTASSSELLARRFAPCTPVQATSPAA